MRKREMNRSKIVRTTLVSKSNSRRTVRGMPSVVAKASQMHSSFCILHFAICNLHCLGIRKSMRAAESPDPQRVGRREPADRSSISINICISTRVVAARRRKRPPAWPRSCVTLGVKVTTGVGGHGVVGVLENGPGKVLMLRADMDALACGRANRPALCVESSHAGCARRDGRRDARLRARHAHDESGRRGPLPGAPIATAGRARPCSCSSRPRNWAPAPQAMLDDGLLDRFPRPDFAVALHVSSDVPTGQIHYRAGLRAGQCR